MKWLAQRRFNCLDVIFSALGALTIQHYGQLIGLAVLLSGAVISAAAEVYAEQRNG